MVSNLVGISWRSRVAGKMGDSEKGSKRKEAVRWEEYLPTTAIRVLLVESDDSTRQILAALLRKCNFKVAAIPDGLKAWEILKQKHCNFDLVLTEVDLPIISGYALLTLIMEHDHCKNIPVIMMSSNDSISVAFECLLKGATDFLIKPLRRNELKNLWQHVWRRIYHANSGSAAQTLLGSRDEAEATFKDRGIRSCSDDDVPSAAQKDQSDEKASDTHSSCATDYLEYEDAYVERMQGLSHAKHRGPSNLSDDEPHRKRVRLDEEANEDNLARSDEAYPSPLRLERVGSFSRMVAWDKRIEPASYKNMGDLSSRESYEQTRQAIDLISTIDHHHELTLQQSISNCEMQNSSTNPQLELSLSNLDEQKPGVQQILNLSNASAFSNCGNSAKLIGFFHSTGRISTVDMEGVKINEKLQHPVKDFSQKESSPLLTNPFLHSGFGETSNCETSIEQKKYANGSAPSQSGNSTLCSNDFTVNQTRVSMEDDIEHELTNEQFEENAKGARNFQREAALAKFRQKRKDRCYQKRVRYQSRKKQAEQRPRVKGQFVRQDQLISDADPA